MTAATHLRLVADNGARVIPLPVRIEHSALRHAVLREARNGLILRDEHRTIINGRTVLAATRAAIDDLTHAGCIAWTGGDRTTGQAAGITTAGRRQLVTWERRSRRAQPTGGGDAA